MTVESPRQSVKRSLSSVTHGKRKPSPKSNSTGAARRKLELRTLQSLRTIFGTARLHDTEVRRIAGLSGSQLWALAEIGSSAALNVRDLSQRMALHQTTASNLVNALVERSLIRRSRDATDQRVVRLHITTEGKRMLLRAPGPYAGLLVDALRQLHRNDLTHLRQALAVLLSAMRDKAIDSAGETLLGE